MRIIVTLVLVACLIAAGAARADSSRVSKVTGGAIFEGCRTGNMFCVAYATGVADMVAMLSVDRKTRFCVPSDVTGGQLVDVAATYMAEHPRDRGDRAIVLIVRAFEEAWPGPCD